MKVAIVGSRKRDTVKDKVAVYDLVNSLEIGDTVVSGGCRGIDTWAVEAAKKRGLYTKEFEPIMLYRYPSYPELVKAYYARNRKIIDSSDVVYAFPSLSGLNGGTKYTVEYAVRQGKKVIFK